MSTVPERTDNDNLRTPPSGCQPNAFIHSLDVSFDTLRGEEFASADPWANGKCGLQSVMYACARLIYGYTFTSVMLIGPLAMPPPRPPVSSLSSLSFPSRVCAENTRFSERPWTVALLVLVAMRPSRN